MLEMSHDPQLARCETSSGIAYWTDGRLAQQGVRVAFSERGGGVSERPYAGLNLAAHVGDSASAVDRNRDLLLESLGIGHLRRQLVCAEQVHGSVVHGVGRTDVGRGAFAETGPPPVPATDALVTNEPGVPLMLFYADCVPVVLVAPGPAVAVVHAGWRGALAGIAGLAVRKLAGVARCRSSSLAAYVGAHVQPCHYEVDETLISQFVNHFGTLARAGSGGLDLGSAVTASLVSAGVEHCRIASLGICTAETTDRFYSYRAEAGLTGRHGALACVMPPPS